MTVSELISSSMRLIGTLASGEMPSTDESNDVFAALNALLDQWSAEPWMIPYASNSMLPLSVGVGSYPAPRPLLIKAASVVTGEGLRVPLDILTADKWAALLERNALAKVPRNLYCDYAYPTAQLSVSPIPSVASALDLYALYPLTALPNQQATLAFPPGYLKALRYSLAVDIAPEFGAQLDPTVAAIAVQAKNDLRALNTLLLNGQSEAAPQVIPAPPAQK